MSEIEGRVRSCCCLGMIDNTAYKCLTRALDLGHCEPTSPCYADCMKRLAAYPREFRRKAGIVTTPARVQAPEELSADEQNPAKARNTPPADPGH